MTNKIFGKKAGAFYFDMFIAGFVILIFLNSFNLSERAARLPLLIGSVTLVFILIDCLVMAAAERKNRMTSGVSDNTAKERSKIPVKEIMITLTFMVMTVVLWHIAGFIISSIIVTVGMGYFLGAKNKRALIISAVLLTLGLYWVFGTFLGVPLPAGILQNLL